MVYLIFSTDDLSQSNSRLAEKLKTPEDLPVPECAVCNHSMSAIVAIDQPEICEKPFIVFQCQNDPGMCGEWESDSGANKVTFVDALQLPNTEGQLGLIFKPSNIPDEKLDSIDEEGSYFSLFENSEYEALAGKALGQPIWIQGDETPTCCNEAMQFLAFIEECDLINFGGGVGYIFKCNQCHEAKFLTQC